MQACEEDDLIRNEAKVVFGKIQSLEGGGESGVGEGEELEEVLGQVDRIDFGKGNDQVHFLVSDHLHTNVVEIEPGGDVLINRGLEGYRDVFSRFDEFMKPVPTQDPKALSVT